MELCFVLRSGCLAPHKKVARSMWISVDPRFCPSLSFWPSESLTAAFRNIAASSVFNVMTGSSTDADNHGVTFAATGDNAAPIINLITFILPH